MDNSGWSVFVPTPSFLPQHVWSKPCRWLQSWQGWQEQRDQGLQGDFYSISKGVKEVTGSLGVRRSRTISKDSHLHFPLTG